MRGCRYSAPPLTSPVSVVDRIPQLHYTTFLFLAKAPFHNLIGAFRRKANYSNDHWYHKRASAWGGDVLHNGLDQSFCPGDNRGGSRHSGLVLPRHLLIPV